MPTFYDFTKVAAAPLHSWLGVLIVTALMTIATIGVHRFGARVVKRIAEPHALTSVVLRYIDKPSLFALVILMLAWIWSEAPNTLNFIEPVRDITGIALIAALTWLSVRSAAAIGEAIIRAHPLDSADNLQARRIHTQARVLARSVMIVIVIVGVGGALMTLPNVRQIGASLLASAGVAGLVAGIAARPVLGNLIAGLQIALSQPLRLDDVVVIQNEWGRIEEITGTYVSVRLWDQRRLIVPLQWFIENPFTNWTRSSSQIIGTVFLFVDYRMPLAPLREELARIVENAPEWDRRVQVLQVFDCTERAMQLRALVSAPDSGLAWDLRCRVREGLVEFIQRHYPECLPRGRAEVSGELEPGSGSPVDWLPRSMQAPAGSTAAHTEADPVATRIGRPEVAEAARNAKERA
ncbi:mechanosensitive ion channel family protein [Paraburkholderia sp. MMS20-SJTR3]|uniref:Mechanosensitive ion channel family protein n=1 Tax=Paraburkholderia sejongensis TaxID=2886946 RepID=A0ABS8JNM0_9BURK|nr:mechanosensitive ion channel domain-containing protein [Paraburkholderia sp. MMS20-SJTR3]MCC8391422.1 mechanosensitive ion channel family protein [Paraburkholderia sp. MMS20-SJTR3]